MRKEWPAVKYHYAAIEREYGSGGAGIGQRLSELSGPPCHGSDILERAITSYGIPLEDAESTLQRFDRKRSRYYGANTGKDWRDWSNYDLILDSGSLGTDTCARILLAAMNG